VLSVHLRFTNTDYPFGIFKLLFRKWNCITHSSYNKQTNRSRFGNKTCCPRCRLVIRLSKKKSWYWIPKFKVHFWCRRKIAKWNLTRKTYMSKRSVYVQFTITCRETSSSKSKNTHFPGGNPNFSLLLPILIGPDEWWPLYQCLLEYTLISPIH
jgi:hypothetical protein